MIERASQNDWWFYYNRRCFVHISSLLNINIFPQLSDFDFRFELHHKLENVKDPLRAMAMLLEALTYDLGQPNKMKLEVDPNSTVLLHSVSHLFGSQLGISTVSESVAQIALLRFSICRNLLIVQQIVLSRPEVFDSRVLHSIRSSLAPTTVLLTQAYYVVMWICESTATCTPPQALL